MQNLRVITIDCWGTMLEIDPTWDDVILEAIVDFLHERHSIERSAVVQAFSMEAENFRAALVERETTYPIHDRVSFLFDQLAVSPNPDDVANLSRIIAQCIAQPSPTPVPGCESFLQRMCNASIGFCVVCNTGWFSGPTITSALQKLNLTRYLAHLVFSDAHGSAKPARSIFDHALALVDCPPNESVHIGDTMATDIVGATRAGIYPIELALGEKASGRQQHVALPGYDDIYDHLRNNFRWKSE